MRGHEISFENYVDTKERKWVGITYALYALGILTGGLSILIAVILAYVRKKADIEGTKAASHYSYIIRTFVLMVIWFLVSSLLMLVLIGYPMIVFVFFWHLYRIFKGAYYFFIDTDVPGYPVQG